MPRKPSIVLGISFGHGDSSAALVVDGCLVAAAEEERFVRIKHYALFPSRAIEYCLRHAKLEPKQVEAVAVARKPSNAFWQKLILGMKHPHLSKGNHGHRHDAEVSQPLDKMLKLAGLRRAKVYRVEHHFAHMMSSRWMPEITSLALLSFDGLGDFVSAAMGMSTDHETRILRRVFFPDSLGFFYTAMTQFLGFPHFGDEFKVMGLSSYGKPRYLPALREMIREKDGFGFTLNQEAFPILKNPIELYIEKSQPRVKPFYSTSFLTHAFGIPARKPKEPLTEQHQDLAKSVQARFEEIANHLVLAVAEKVGGETLALSGGCAHNSVWVGKIPKSTPFKKVFVAPASHDAGIAAGAAIQVAGVPVYPQGHHWGLLGPDVDESVPLPPLSHDVKERAFIDDDSLIAWMVRELADGKIVGLFRGRMEFGPRALGSRSILADPRNAEMRERLNERVKHREPFRPFAASVLWEHQAKWFNDSFFCPSMEAVFDVKEAVRHRIAAVTHVDNTCRVQSVTKETQPFYWALIDAFRRATGVPMLVNTSFNDSEPIVCTEKDALACFLGSDLDHLVIGNKAYTKAREKMALAG